MTVIDCATTGLTPYIPSTQMPWNEQRALHVLRRLGFGASVSDLNNLLSQNPNAIADTIDNMIDDAIALPLPPTPEWGYWSAEDYVNNGFDDLAGTFIQNVTDLVTEWMESMNQNGLREKLTLFWHNHFVTRIEDYNCAPYLYQYHRILQAYALGNFKDFVYEMGKTPAMLFFLNGVQNTKFEPNENYARELFELFTLGLDNGYTQNDIEETARSLTGWNGISGACSAIDFVPILHDDGVKTIFGQTGNWNYDDLHNILFEERGMQIAQFICSKIYHAFINPNHPNSEDNELINNLINELATTLVNNDFELAFVFRQLFKSEHFFDDANIGVQIKSPIEYYFDLGKAIEFTYNADAYRNVYFAAADLGQALFNPPNVAGWEGNRSWIDSNSLPTRWVTVGGTLYLIFQVAPELFRSFAKSLVGDSNDALLVTQKITDFFIPKGLQNFEDYEKALTAFKMDVPENYFENGTWNLDWDSAPAQVATLIYYLVRVPEFQLH